MLRVGIWGVGAGSMRVWEALLRIEFACAACFIDSDPARHGEDRLGLAVLAPAALAMQGLDAVVVGSMSRDAIVDQLRRLGVPDERVFSPTLASVDEMHDGLRRGLKALLPPRARL